MSNTDWFVITADDEAVGPGDYVFDTLMNLWGVIQREIDSEGRFIVSFDNGERVKRVAANITVTDIEYDKMIRAKNEEN